MMKSRPLYTSSSTLVLSVAGIIVHVYIIIVTRRFIGISNKLTLAVVQSAKASVFPQFGCLFRIQAA